MNTTLSSTIDVRTIAAQHRHALIFERLTALPPGDAIELVNDHDPVPLRSQIERHWPGQYECNYLDSGPALWRMEIRKLVQPERPKAAGGSCCSGGACCG